MSRHDLYGRVYIVTGAGHRLGLGAATVSALLMLGANVVVNGRNFDPDWMDDLHSQDRTHIIVGDIVDDTIQELCVNTAKQKWNRLDGLINNASTGAPAYDDQGLLTAATWHENFMLNCATIYYLSHRCRALLKHYQGSIVNIASRAASKVGAGNNLAYAASKAAMLRVSEELAITMAPDITVNCVSPGLIESQRIVHIMQDRMHAVRSSWAQQSQLGRAVQFDEVVDAILLCLTNRAMTGQNLAICGTAAL